MNYEIDSRIKYLTFFCAFCAFSWLIKHLRFACHAEADYAKADDFVKEEKNFLITDYID